MHAYWYFDFISPFAWLQLPKLREWRARIDIEPVPIVLGAVLAHNSTLGPAEIPGRREFTYRFARWQAEQAGVLVRFPPAHPFNSLAALRLCIAADSSWPAVETIFTHIWNDGRDAADVESLTDVAAALAIDDVTAAIGSSEVKSRLRTNTDTAIAAGVFGVPTLRIGKQLFWGNDASPMIDDWLANPHRFESAEYQRIAKLPVGIVRKR